MTVSWGFNPFTGNLDALQSLGNYNLIPENVVIVKSGIVEVEGEKYTSIANAIIYINTQAPSAVNRWGISLLDLTNSENFTVPDFVSVYSAKGYDGLLETQLTGNITVGLYSTLNSVQCTGQITAGSTNAAAPSVFFGAYLAGTVISGAGTYLQFVTTLLQLSSDLELGGSLLCIDSVWISSNLNVNAGGTLTGNLTKVGGAIVDNGGTNRINSAGTFYDNNASGLTADTMGDAIDELENEIDSVISTKVPYTGATGTVNLGAQDLTTTGGVTGTTVTGTTVTGTTVTDGTATLTSGDLTGLTTLGMTTVTDIDDIIDDDTMASASATTLATSESIKAYADAAGLWKVNSDEAELKVERDIDIKEDNKLFFN